MRDYERNGLALDEEPRNQLKKLKQGKLKIERKKNKKGN